LAETLLFVPVLLKHFLCGEKSTEFTMASVSQLYNRKEERWDPEILRAFRLPERIFPSVVSPAKMIGEVKREILEKSSMQSLSVCAVGQHDTASAVASIPSLDPEFAYISSGTWSLVGTETDLLITTDEAFQENFANEGGVCGTNRFSKNVMGLWLIQEYQRELEAQGQRRTFAEMDREAQSAEPFVNVIDPDDLRFFEPGEIAGKIRGICRETRQPAPDTIGAFLRCMQESLALAYRDTLEKLERVTGRIYPVVHIIGGGAQSALLNQMTASATKKPVLAGPYEATAIGNLCVQFMAAGEIHNLPEARRIVRASFPVREFLPGEGSAWDAAYERFLSVKYQGVPK
jgi:sugar (pentulose or hexulose) kinase